MHYSELACEIMTACKSKGIKPTELFDATSLMMILLGQIMQIDPEEFKGRMVEIEEYFEESNIPEELTEALYRDYLKDCSRALYKQYFLRDDDEPTDD